MKVYISILPILACIYGAGVAFASECDGDTCDIDTTYVTETTESELTLSGSDIDLYNQTMADTIATRKRIDELLAQYETHPDDVVTTTTETFDTTTIQVPENVVITGKSFAVNGDGCPFATARECDIWRRKPTIHETMIARVPRFRDVNMLEFMGAMNACGDVDGNDVASAPLIARYRLLMRAARACCTDGLVHELHDAGASDGLIYKFLSDDANFYGFGNRCLMMSDAELDDTYPNTATATVVSDVRNGCLCRSREWFESLLSPFARVYALMPDFRDAPFYYTYTDGLQRSVTVSINADVQNVLNQLAVCP